METSLVVSIIIAVVAIIPAVFALVSQKNKDKIQSRMDMERVSQRASIDLIGPLQEEISRLSTRATNLESELVASKYRITSLSKNADSGLKNTEEHIWKRMYEKPVIVRCGYCNAGNVITNTECVKCGAPIGGKNA